MIVTIHQPNFMPWYPFFEKMGQADIFVILENCQFEKNNFQNRFNMNDKWYTLRVHKGMDAIVNKRYIDAKYDWKIIKKNLLRYENVLNLFDDDICDELSVCNTNIILKMASLLSIKTKIVTDYPTELRGTDRLVDICLKNNATTYISGVSGRKYLDIDKFTANGITVTFQDESTKKPILEVLSNKINER